MHGPKRRSPWTRGRLARVPPWLVLGAASILLAIVLILAIRNFNREKRYMVEILEEKGTVLINAFESGVRTGMMGTPWGGPQAQTLLEEIARQPSVLYLVITDRNGRILAADDRARIGTRFLDPAALSDLAPGEAAAWRMVPTEDGRKAFEVYRYFRPLAGCSGEIRKRVCHGRHAHATEADWSRACCHHADRVRAGPGGERQIIFVGLDVSPFEAARREDIRHTAVLSAVLVLLGFGGFLSLFWLQGYRETKRLLADTSAFAAEVVANLPVGVIATGPDGKIAFLNPAAEGIIGIPSEEARGKGLEVVLPEQWKDLRRVLDRGEVIVEREQDCLLPRGNLAPLSLSGTKIVSEEGRFVGYLLILRDLREVRRLQEEIRQKEKLAALGSMAAGVAHEIRNPLSSIKGLATLFAARFEAESEGRAAAATMLREVDRLNRVITELLEFARPSDLKPREVDLAALLDHSIRLVRREAEAKGIEVRLSTGARCPTLRLDPDRFSQALLNLYLNSIQAMSRGGVLTVEVTRPDQDHVAVQVADTGSGIDPKDLDKILDPYFTTKPGGTGLGLAIVDKIVAAHGGRIRVRSKPGEGTVFTILLPIDARRTDERRDRET